MILLLTGTDNFRINQRLGQLRQGYDPLSISVFQDNLNFEKIKQETAAVSFFSIKKLVIVYSAGKVKDSKFQQKLVDWLEKADENLEIVFIEEEERVNAWLLNLIRKKGQVETYSLLKPHEVTRWIKDRVKEKDGTIDIIAAEKLTQLLGNDLWRISNEIDKLIAYDKKLTTETINILVEPEFLDSIFSLVDAIAEKKEKKALSIMNRFLKEEGNEPYLISMIARQIRNLLAVKDLASRGKKEAEIASKLKLHPFVVKNTLRQSRNLTQEQLLSFHHALLEADLDLKTSTDSKTTLFRLVHTFCSN
jgi:DNA polymerase-3 subunit delta